MSMTLTPTDVGLDLEFMRRVAPEMARDIVCQLDNASKVAASYGLTDFQWGVLKEWPAFVQLVKNANEELGGTAGTLERARRKAALAVSEFGVTDAVAIMGDPKASHKDKLSALELLVEIGGVTLKAQGVGAGNNAAAAVFGGSLINFSIPEKPKVIEEAPIDAAAAAVAALERKKQAESA